MNETVEARVTKFTAFRYVKPNGSSKTIKARCEALWFEADNGSRGIFIPSENVYFYETKIEDEATQLINEFLLTK